uniref:Malate dehydrogenase n=1 Tax=Setaria digitata TaxID=48799 RepID=A0A915PDW4_9BILA
MFLNRTTNRLITRYSNGIQLDVASVIPVLSCSSSCARVHTATKVTASNNFNCFMNFNRNLMTKATAGDKIVEIQEAVRFAVDCMVKAGTSKKHAEQLADVLIMADIRGHYSHGLNRLAMYVRDVREGICRKDGSPKILKERSATAWIDGNNLLGPVVGNFCMDLAIKKAKEAGVGWVVAKGSNHFGIAGWYSIRAMDEGLLLSHQGMAFTNTSPMMYPTRSSMPALGTNPITLAAKGLKDNFILDMATTTAAIGKVELAARKEQVIPDTWGVAADGHVSKDPKKILDGGGLLPLGGAEFSGGYKGYGLGALVEIFCGILGGAQWGPNIRQWMSVSVIADLGQCFIAIDPEAFAPNFRDRLQKFIDTMRSLKPGFYLKQQNVFVFSENAWLLEADDDSVLIAGDPENQHIALVEKYGGIPYHPNQITHAEELAETLSVQAMFVKSTV